MTNVAEQPRGDGLPRKTSYDETRAEALRKHIESAEKRFGEGSEQWLKANLELQTYIDNNSENDSTSQLNKAHYEAELARLEAENKRKTETALGQITQAGNMDQILNGVDAFPKGEEHRAIRAALERLEQLNDGVSRNQLSGALMMAISERTRNKNSRKK